MNLMRTHQHPLPKETQTPPPRPRVIIYGIMHKCESCLCSVEIFPEEYIRELSPEKEVVQYFHCPVCKKKQEWNPIKII